MRRLFSILFLAVLACGCASRSRMAAQNAFLAGQNAALREQLSAQSGNIVVRGPVRNHSVPWSNGLTLAQAVAAAEYLETRWPEQVLITRQGETAALEANALLGGTPIPLEAGDVVELR
jgi:hypothetical protein